MKSRRQSIIMLIFIMPIVILILFSNIAFARPNTEVSAEVSIGEKQAREKKLIIYAYDSFISEWGMGPQIQAIFTEQTGYTIEFIEHGDDIATYNALIQTPVNIDYPDLLIGIGNNMASIALESKLFTESNISDDIVAHIPKHLFFDDNKTLVPFDYGYISVLYDSRKISLPPTSLEDLTDSRFKNALVLTDPRSSSSGLAFFLWTVATYDDDYKDYWNKLKPSILSVASSWSTAYGLFTAGEAPLVISYTTSPAYHIEYENTDYIKATVFEEGNYLQVEYAAITKNAQNKKAAEAFIAFMVSPEFQKKVALTNIMYPARDDIPLPDSFDTLLTVSTSIDIHQDNNQNTNQNQGKNSDTVNTKKLLDTWGEIMSSKKTKQKTN